MTPDGNKVLAQYGDESSFGISYNLYADKLLGLNLVPTEVGFQCFELCSFLIE